jgi:glycosyltransferase involved in cell wall biosynthesis
MKISIAMATYNGERFILEQLQSFMDQTRQPDELIITDDCSGDSTEAIILEFIKVAPFKVIFHRNEKNIGYCGNFNAALMRTSGDLVFLSDQDDVWLPEKIEHIISIANDNPEALVIMNDALLTDGELNEVGLTKIEQIQSAGLDLDCFVMGCCSTVRREFLDFCLPIVNGLNSHDDWIVELATSLNRKIIFPEVLQYYRRHETNESQFIANRITKVTKKDVFFDRLKTLVNESLLDNTSLLLEQRKFFAAGIAHGMVKAPKEFLGQLTQIEVQNHNQIKSIEKRISILKKPFILRALAVFILFLKGGYSNNGGVKRVVRDILG